MTQKFVLRKPEPKNGHPNNRHPNNGHLTKNETIHIHDSGQPLANQRSASQSLTENNNEICKCL